MVFKSRMQKYRQRLRNDPKSLKNHLEKERKRDQMRRKVKKLNMDEIALKEHRVKVKERQRKYRQAKRRTKRHDVPANNRHASLQATASSIEENKL